LRGHFVGTVRLEGVEPIGASAYLLRVRTDGGAHQRRIALVRVIG
jgi:hypothetical protein